MKKKKIIRRQYKHMPYSINIAMPSSLFIARLPQSHHPIPPNAE